MATRTARVTDDVFKKRYLEAVKAGQTKDEFAASLGMKIESCSARISAMKSSLLKGAEEYAKKVGEKPRFTEENFPKLKASATSGTRGKSESEKFDDFWELVDQVGVEIPEVATDEVEADEMEEVNA